MEDHIPLIMIDGKIKLDLYEQLILIVHTNNLLISNM